MGELLQVHYNLCIAREVSDYFDEEIKNVAKIKALADLICIFPALEKDIDRCIVSETEMADNASHELKSLRRSIQRQNETIRTKLAQIVSKSENKSVLQDSLVTMRHGRYVIPVKQEHKSKVTGIVHDQSQTGATLFIEPQIIVNLNNELSELKLAEEKEVHRILDMLTRAVAAQSRIILNNQELLGKLDFIFARARLGIDMGAFSPKISDGYIEVRKARHPLLDAKKVVPIDITIDKCTKALIITGPNTGGKTVTLKTLGLFCLMFQSGLQIPAEEGSSLPVFTRIFADIGDEQSIEQSLSTFSSHMTNIVAIMKEADENSLVLFDELGAGTDPQEGASLAIAILEEIMQKGAMCLATTHYTELKKFAIETAGVQNASMEFNIETLSPTYHLILGLPGKSNAFANSICFILAFSSVLIIAGVLTSTFSSFVELSTTSLGLSPLFLSIMTSPSTFVFLKYILLDPPPFIISFPLTVTFSNITSPSATFSDTTISFSIVIFFTATLLPTKLADIIFFPFPSYCPLIDFLPPAFSRAFTTALISPMLLFVAPDTVSTLVDCVSIIFCIIPFAPSSFR